MVFVAKLVRTYVDRMTALSSHPLPTCTFKWSTRCSWSAGTSSSQSTSRMAMTSHPPKTSTCAQVVLVSMTFSSISCHLTYLNQSPSRRECLGEASMSRVFEIFESYQCRCSRVAGQRPQHAVSTFVLSSARSCSSITHVVRLSIISLAFL